MSTLTRRKFVIGATALGTTAALGGCSPSAVTSDPDTEDEESENEGGTIMPDDTTYPYTAEHLFTYDAMLDSPGAEVIVTNNGIRNIVYVTGGKVWGPKVNGTVRPVGGDWCFIRPDGILVLGVRITFETDDGALIYVQYSGTLDMGEDGYQNIIEGKPTKESAIFTQPILETDHPDYLWLNRITCFGIGRIIEGGVQYDVYGLHSEV